MIRKRISAHQYKSVLAFRDDVELMFTNATNYNQEGSWVYVDAIEMQKVFHTAFARAVGGSGLPGADAAAPAPPAAAAAGAEDALTPQDDEETRPPAPTKKNSRRVVASDDEYLTQSDDE